MKILVDPGHAWNGNSYPPQPGYYEGTQMWKLSTYLIPELEKYGFEVATTRPNLKDFMDIADRGKMAKGFDLVVSLHSNAPGGNDTSVTGTYIIYTMSTPKIKPLADDMGQRIAELMRHRYRGSIIMESTSRKGEDRNSVLRNAIRVGCKAGLLIEHGFHTNPKDSAFLIVDDNLKKLAIAEAEAIATYYGKESDTMLKRGDKNEAVKYFQTLLLKAGYDLAQYGADGSFGGVTVRAVEALQDDAGLPRTGRLDIYTIMALIDRTGTAEGLEKELEEAKEELKGYKGFFAKLKEYLS